MNNTIVGSGLEGHRKLLRAFVFAASIQVLLLVATFGFSMVGKTQTSHIVAFDMAAGRLYTDFEKVSDDLQRFYRELAAEAPSQPYIENMQGDLKEKVVALKESLSELVVEDSDRSGPFETMDEESRALLAEIVPNLDAFIGRASSFADTPFATLKTRFARPSVVDLVSGKTGRVRRSLEKLVVNARKTQQRNIEYVHAGNVAAILLLLLSFFGTWRLIIAPALAEQKRAIHREVEISESLSCKNTELQAAECRARLLYEDALRGVRARTEFLAVVSHELRTPLNAVIGFSEIMKDELFGKHEVDAYRGFSGDIHQSGKHLLSVVEDILEFSRYESGQYELDESDVPLKAIISDARMLLGDQAAKRNITLVFRDKLPEGMSIRVDKRLINQALINLIDNAIKFSPSGSVVTVIGKVGLDGGAVIEVVDSGIGIDTEIADALFEPFEQVEGAFNRQAGGLGLGLAIAKKIIESHRGEISVESRLEEGSRFTLHLPEDRVIRRSIRTPRDTALLTREGNAV